MNRLHRAVRDSSESWNHLRDATEGEGCLGLYSCCRVVRQVQTAVEVDRLTGRPSEGSYDRL
jgi:hypothetical protein